MTTTKVYVLYSPGYGIDQISEYTPEELKKEKKELREMVGNVYTKVFDSYREAEDWADKYSERY